MRHRGVFRDHVEHGPRSRLQTAADCVHPPLGERRKAAKDAAVYRGRRGTLIQLGKSTDILRLTDGPGELIQQRREAIGPGEVVGRFHHVQQTRRPHPDDRDTIDPLVGIQNRVGEGERLRSIDGLPRVTSGGDDGRTSQTALREVAFSQAHAREPCIGGNDDLSRGVQQSHRGDVGIAGRHDAQQAVQRVEILRR